MAGLAFLVFSFPSFAQNIDVRGVVKDVQGVPVAGAGVFVDGTSQGSGTSLDGEYVLENVPSDAVLSVSCIGYKTLAGPDVR